MAKKPARKLASKVAPKKPAKAPPKSAAPKPSRPAKPTIAEHRVAVAGVALHVRHGRGRSEELELRGTAAINVGAPESVVRTTGVVRLSASDRSGNVLSYNPASLNRNLVLTLAVDDVDLALLRAIFVTGTGSELSDPALTVWATTMGPLAPDTASEAPILEFGYSLDFDPGPSMGSR
jgi:hypothetical protein